MNLIIIIYKITLFKIKKEKDEKTYSIKKNNKKEKSMLMFAAEKGMIE
jgi:hypothetical protein